MNIGLIRMRYTPYGGAEVFLSRFIDELIKNGHTCHLFAAKWDEDIKDGVIWHKVKTFGPSFLRLLSFAVNAWFAVKRTAPDVIVSFERTLYQDIYRAGDGCHKEWLIQRRQVTSHKSQVTSQIILLLKQFIVYFNPRHLTILYLEKKLFKSKKLKFVVANSNRGKEEIIRHYKLPEDNICVIYNGIDINEFDLGCRDKIRAAYREKLNIKDEIALLFVGSGFDRKGLWFLIEAVGILKRNGYNKLKLIVAGKGKIRKYKNAADRLGIGKDVIFTGPVKDVQGYYSAADIFILPSIYEPFSNACMEAMASGLPVVTSRINGVSEILTDGKDGMIIDVPANPEEIAEKIKPLLDERARQAVGREARMTVVNYSIERNVERFLRLIDEVRGGLKG
ncbi:MAG: glycosyltransferase family 4 protein [Deltaproteobacteria bacterium]|nr:glycosyltransferase family 4 protein [Deltaproteobacteria bacterium]